MENIIKFRKFILDNPSSSIIIYLFLNRAEAHHHHHRFGICDRWNFECREGLGEYPNNEERRPA